VVAGLGLRGALAARGYQREDWNTCRRRFSRLLGQRFIIKRLGHVRGTHLHHPRKANHSLAASSAQQKTAGQLLGDRGSLIPGCADVTCG
jgi:hypothetical protein